MIEADENTEFRHRKTISVPAENEDTSGNDGLPNSPQKISDIQPTSDDSDADALFDGQKIEDLQKMLPQNTDHLGAYIDPLLTPLSQRWRNCLVRFIFTIVMVTLFSWIIKLGPSWLMALVFVLQFWCFHEIITIGLSAYRLYDLPWFRALSWYFLLCSNYFFFGENLIDFWAILLQKDEFLQFLVTHHRLISFLLYCVGFVWFILSLRKNYYMRQFSLFALTHVTLFLIVLQSFLIIQNIFQGLIWFLVPVSMVICCDIMSYMFGMVFGRTPLIKISPKKTWEGFIGGAISTLLFGLLLSYFLIKHPFFVCPIEDYTEEKYNCTIPPSFIYRELQVPRPVAAILRLFGRSPTIRAYPFLFHTVVMSLFASILGPFGGFFASGFKRAFKIKDFGDIIPGHGGLMDRFDCQLLMGSFVNVYIHTFIKTTNPAKLLQQIAWLSPEAQLALYQSLRERLEQDGLLAVS